MLTRRTLITGGLGAATAVALGAEPAQARSPRLPDEYVISGAPAFQPEGITGGPGGRFWVGSLTTGDVVVGDRRLRTMRPFAAGAAAGRDRALGLSWHRGRLWVTRPDGLDLYDLRGRLVQQVQVPDGTPSLNDLAFTREAVYVTDDANAVVHRAPLRAAGCGELRPWFVATDWHPEFQTGWWFLNGIVSTRDPELLLVSSQGLGSLIRLDPATGSAAFVDVEGAADGFFGPDGMRLSGRRLAAVLNYRAPAGRQGVYFVDLNRELTAGRQLPQVLDAGLDSPTTLELDRDRILVVNSQLDHAPGTPPYTVTAFPDPR
ncbi:hypothetical protein [Microlunatus parietis]|uniref:Sugar lactone lactonase YvrE n=1 Tax=Microlunatus parietis TaxID=682979 RepID=A0A7Y9I602_9ACTN|nr:hypothetical protein [Microlunatus parietis]NYE70660.1 hypothetical protein [Microlunatus parietis]